ncbi:putative phage-associated protein [Actinoplanes lutulentus]|uniref:Putative phage-associated protein n=1 Tax=Actinoplanes lutulentus TaxID=1287878 RepID=A0A327ZHI9_9ACTN|nr:type II toxin-antitoxin system antitoxin SocA domain-containing protein [Actinoplanes lutulentus]MBB2944426.1 putative phage-associated protein [Actinoplanes lutulentus]RAK42342.1 putative phage-associated protein [Actinoplanes lutulentus]
MATAHDVAAYVLDKLGPMSAMKLQKLLYYSQAWHLVWDEQPLFPERIEAWANGPVVADLYRLHRGQFLISEWPQGDRTRLTPAEQESIDAVLESYGDLDGRKLSHLTHAEAPWADARKGLHPTDRSDIVITHAAMHEYYGSLDAAEEAVPIDELSWEGWSSGAA